METKTIKAIKNSEVEVTITKNGRYSETKTYHVDAKLKHPVTNTEMVIAMVMKYDGYDKTVSLKCWKFKTAEMPDLENCQRDYALEHGGMYMPNPYNEITDFSSFEMLGVTVDYSEIQQAVIDKVKELEEIENRKREEANRSARAEQWDKSLLINKLKPMLEAKGHDVEVNTTKEIYMNEKHLDIALNIDDQCRAFIGFNNYFTVVKNRSNKALQNLNISEKTTRSMKPEKWLEITEAFISNVKRNLQDKNKEAEKKIKDEKEISAIFGVQVKVSKHNTGYYKHGRGQWVCGHDYYTYSPNVETRAKNISVQKIKTYDDEKKEYVDCFSISIPVTTDPKKLKAIFDLFNK